MIRLIIIADDFTGGLDTGVQFSQKGIRTRVVTDWKTDYLQAAGECEVLVIVSETRHLTSSEAARIVSAIVRKAVALDIPFIYKKTDSGLRGNIGAELSAALNTGAAKVLPFLPSLPALGRLTVGGIHYISGVPVAQSVFGRDPFDPVTESNVSQLIHQQSPVPVSGGSPDHFPQHEGIWVIDAASEEDLVTAGRKLRDAGHLRVMAGCAGFASALPDLLELRKEPVPTLPTLPSGLLVLCGSVNPITRRQLAHAELAGFTRIHLLPEQKLNAGYFESADGLHALETWRQMYEDLPWLILDANDSDPDNASSLAFIASHSMSMEHARQCVSDSLGQILPVLLESPAKRTVLITGGDTLLKCMEHLNITRMEPLLELFPGVVLSSFETDRQRYIITKSGGFGTDTLLCDLKDLLINKQRRES